MVRASTGIAASPGTLDGDIPDARRRFEAHVLRTSQPVLERYRFVGRGGARMMRRVHPGYVAELRVIVQLAAWERTGLVGGWKVNFKRVHRIWKEEHMEVPRKQRKRRRLPGTSANGCVRHRATHRNHVWSYDFLTQRTEDGRQQRILVVIDEFTRECLAIEVARSFTARDVIMTLQYLFAVRGAPEHLRSDNGPEEDSPVNGTSSTVFRPMSDS